MAEYSVTISYGEHGETSTLLVVTINAVSMNDAFIMGASKAYAMFAGTEIEIRGIAVVVVPTT